MSDIIGSETKWESVSGRARGLEPLARRDIAVEVLERKKSAAQVAREEGVSRKFVAAQVTRARDAIDQAFDEPGTDLKTTGDDRVFFQIAVTPRLIRRSVLGLLLYCHSCYRGVKEFLQDVLGITVSIGTIHNIARQATERARLLNAQEDLSRVRIGAHDEIFQNSRPVLVGCDVDSTYCYLLSLEDHRDAET